MAKKKKKKPIKLLSESRFHIAKNGDVVARMPAGVVISYSGGIIECSIPGAINPPDAGKHKQDSHAGQDTSLGFDDDDDLPF